MDQETELEDDLIEVVLAEAMESLESALWTLRAVGQGPQSPEIVASLFRCFHSIKGNTAMAGRTVVSKMAHRIENALDVVRESVRPLLVPEAKLLIEAADLLYPLLEEVTEQEMAAISERMDRCLNRLDEELAVVQAGGQSLPASAAMPFPSTEPSDGGSAPSGAEPGTQPGQHSAKLRVDAQSIVEAMTVVGELFQIDERLKFFVHGAQDETDDWSQREMDRWDGMTQLSRELDSAIEKLYEQLLDIQRVPVSQLTAPLERSLRDICRKTGKRIELKVRGQDLRIDRGIMQSLQDPLMHMIRNAADHGVEGPEERAAAGKSERSTIQLSLEEHEEVVIVVLADDGRGIDPRRVCSKAIEKGLVDAETASRLSEEELIEFIFHPGFSTAAAVSELSGRGVGMDVVARHIRDSGGSIETRTTLGEGSCFTIEVPKLGSPVLDGVALRSGTSVYLVPMLSVLCFVARTDFQVVTDPRGGISALLHDKLYPMSFLPGCPEVHRLKSPRTIGVLVEDRKHRQGMIVVDEVLGRRKALSQKLGYEPCHRARQTDVAILGDGTMGFAISVDEHLGRALVLGNPDQQVLEVQANDNQEQQCAS